MPTIEKFKRGQTVAKKKPTTATRKVSKIELPQHQKPKKRDLRLFASEAMPLRSSLLSKLVKCPMSFIETLDDEFIANDKMQTGSAVHALIETLERQKEAPNENQRKEIFRKYPKAEEREATLYYDGYVRYRDVIEAKYGKLIGIEKEAICKLPPATIDPTQEEIIITCTRDQLRKRGDTYYVIDFKVSSAAIGDLLKTYALQMSAYQIATSQEQGTDRVHSVLMNPVAMSKPRSMYDYVSKMSNKRCLDVLDTVRVIVAGIRAGIILKIPGYSCTSCPMRSPEYC